MNRLGRVEAVEKLFLIKVSLGELGLGDVSLPQGAEHTCRCISIPIVLKSFNILPCLVRRRT